MANPSAFAPLSALFGVGHHHIDQAAILRTGDVELAEIADLIGTKGAFRLRAAGVVRRHRTHLGSKIARHSTWCVIGRCWWS